MGWPTTTDPKENFITVRFTDDEIAALDGVLCANGETRSAVIREAVWVAVVAQRAKMRKKTGLSKNNPAGA